MTLKTGTLRQWLTIENRVATPDPQGGEVVTWTLLPTLRGDGKVAANVRFQSGMETLRNDTLLAPRKASARVQWRADLSPLARATFDGVIYDIKSMQPDPDTGRDYLDLVLEGGTNNG